jgi:hypothetical protein
MSRNKLKLTEELVAQLPEANRISPESARIAWWFNLRPNGGLRLTKMGYEALAHQIKLAHYEYNVEPLTITSKMIIALDRKLQQPWYLYTVKMMPRTLVFFGSKEAMMANLYGDLKKFLDNYS